MNPDTELCPWLPRALSDVNTLLLESVKEVPGYYRKNLENLLSKGGKRLRPRLALVAGSIGSSVVTERLIRLATGIELLHTATLIHDDVIDDAKTRRGIPSMNALYSARQAVISGDYLLAKSLSLLHSVLPAESTGDFLSGILHICKSELLQHTSRFIPSVSIRNYYRRIAGKTAALFVLSCYVGGIEAKLTKPEMQGLRRYGYNLGMAFQIIDDILDLNGNSDSLQKPTFQDESQGIYTLPVIIAMRENPETVQLISKYSKKHKAVPRKKLYSFLKTANAIEQSYSVANHIKTRGLSALELLPDSQAKTYLVQLIESLSIRTS